MEKNFDFFLHASAGLLDLPAFVSGAVVGNREFEFHEFYPAKLSR